MKKMEREKGMMMDFCFFGWTNEKCEEWRRPPIYTAIM
jgi:hypothetical protein